MLFLDTFFAGYRLYRRLRGGVWNEVAPWTTPSVGSVWVRGHVLVNEHVVAMELWP